MSNKTLVLNASVQQEGSLTRELVAHLLENLEASGKLGETIERDLAKNEMELITSDHVGAYYTPPSDRTDAQKAVLEQSDELLSELKAVNQLVIGTPMYNFSVPAVLKAWIDLICRVGETFKYTENGPVGLLNIDKAYFVVATGGTPIEGAADFVVPYLKQIAKFIGVKEVVVIQADGLGRERDVIVNAAKEQIALAA